MPYTGGPLEEGEAAYPINEVQIGPSGTQYENFSIKSTCQTQIDIGAELAKRPDVNIQKNGEPEVLIMHTHTCEARRIWTSTQDNIRKASTPERPTSATVWWRWGTRLRRR